MPRVLIVDDQPDICDLLRSILSLRYREIETVEGGAQALERIAAGDAPDVIVLDVQMPDMDGWDTLAEIRRRYGEFGPRVVMCTVKGHPRDLLHGWTIGCDGYVWKPFDLKSLVDEVAAVLGRTDAARAEVRRTAVGEARMMLRSLV